MSEHDPSAISTDRPAVSDNGAPDGVPANLADLAAAYAELQSLLLETPDVDQFLARVAVLAAAIIPDTSCGITLRRGHELATAATSDDFAMAVDEIQYGRGQGPCLQALHRNEIVHSADLAEDDRWADYRIHALGYGVRSSLSLPLVVAGENRGALNLYAKTPNAFNDQAIERGRAFAEQAATALTIALRRADEVVMQAQLREALATRAIIDQAIGIIMGQQLINATEAFAVLRNTSQTRNRKLRDIAADLIETITGEPPKPPKPFADPR